MESCITDRWSAAAPQVELRVTEQSETPTTSTLHWELLYIAPKAAYTNSNRDYEVTINGDVVRKGSYDIDRKTGTNTIASGNKIINKKTGPQSINFSIYFAFKLKWNGDYCSSKSASSHIWVSRMNWYDISYNANGGTGAPSGQTKWYDTALTLSSTKPSRTGHSFLGWSASRTATSPTWYAGGLYKDNVDRTLYAVWKPHTYNISYNANGGIDAPPNQTKTYGAPLTISNLKPTKQYYVFLGWSTSETSDIVAYKPGDSYTDNSATTLYAVWKLAYIPPKISSFSVDRCDSTGTLSEEGMCGLVMFNWELDKNRTLKTVKIEWKNIDDPVYTKNLLVSTSGTKGTVREIIGNNDLTTESAYNVQITITDDIGNTSIVKTIAQMKFVIDFLKGGTGVAFGKPAENPGYVDFDTKILLQNGKSIYGKSSDRRDFQLMGIDAKNKYIVGYGGYENNVGATQIYGNNVSLTSKNNVNVDAKNNVSINGKIILNSCHFSGGKVLWSGNWYMQASQVAELSEPVSKQPNGLILIFSNYNTDTSQATNYYFNSVYIPKHLVSLHDGSGHSMLLTGNANLGTISSKYLYISDSKIVGNDENKEYGTQNGVQYDNRKFVLRYVLGI